MKMTVKTKTLRDALKKVIKASAKHSPLPVLGYVKMSAKTSGQVTMDATDLEIGIRLTMEAEVTSDGSVCVPAAIITTLVGEINDENITIESVKDVSGNEDTMKITHSSGGYTLYGKESDDFPLFPLDGRDDGESLTVPEYDLSVALKAVMPCIANMEEQRAALTGAYVETAATPNGTDITVTSTDARSLAQMQLSSDIEDQKPMNFILPQKAVGLIVSLCGKAGAMDEAQIGLYNHHFTLTTPEFSMFSRLIDSKYPNYNAVIPKSSDYVYTFDRNALMGALNRVMLFSTDTETPDLMMLELKGEKAYLSGNTIGVGDGREEIEPLAVSDATDMQIAFNGRYMRGVVQSLDGDNITLAMNTPVMPIQITGEDSRVLYIVMPVRLRKAEEDFELKAA
jgi:DNA polymerase-3 subunit beta